MFVGRKRFIGWTERCEKSEKEEFIGIAKKSERLEFGIKKKRDAIESRKSLTSGGTYPDFSSQIFSGQWAE